TMSAAVGDSFGDAPDVGSMRGTPLAQPIAGVATTATGKGYWLVARDGGIFSFGDAAFHGSTGAIHLNQPIVGIAPTPSGNGYWLVAGDGGVFSFGDAGFAGSAAGRIGRAVGIARAAAGYWIAGANGTAMGFGGAQTFGAGSTPSTVVGVAPTPSGLGYVL